MTPNKDVQHAQITNRVQKEICSAVIDIELNKLSETTWVVGAISKCLWYKVRIYLYFKIPLYKQAGHLYRLGHTIMGLDYMDFYDNKSEVVKIEYVDAKQFLTQNAAIKRKDELLHYWINKCKEKMKKGPYTIPFNSCFLAKTWATLLCVHMSGNSIK